MKGGLMKKAALLACALMHCYVQTEDKSFKLCVPQDSAYDIHFIIIQYNHDEHGPHHLNDNLVHHIKSGECKTITVPQEVHSPSGRSHPYEFYITRIEAKNSITKRSVKHDIGEDATGKIEDGLKIPFDRSALKNGQTFTLTIKDGERDCQSHQHCVCNKSKKRPACFILEPSA